MKSPLRILVCSLTWLILTAGMSAQDSPPVPTKQVKPEYPLIQRMIGFEGDVVVDFIVDSKGMVRNPFVMRSSNPALDEAAIEAVLDWRFKPGIKDGQPVNARMQVPIMFRLDEGGKGAFEIQTTAKAQKKLPPEFRYDKAPVVLNMESAVYPYAPLLAGIKGEVEFVFVVDIHGNAAVVRVVKSTGDEFTAAVHAMVNVMRFKPALKDGQPTQAVLRMKLKFSEHNGEVTLSRSGRKLLGKLRKPGPHPDIAAASELDEKLQPLSQKPPRFPQNLNVETGQAVIDFLVDENGIAQLPQVVSASDPAFGYAACQAIAAWRFKPPTRNGKGVAVQVRVPVGFKLKE